MNSFHCPVSSRPAPPRPVPYRPAPSRPAPSRPTRSSPVPSPPVPSPTLPSPPLPSLPSPPLPSAPLPSPPLSSRPAPPAPRRPVILYSALSELTCHDCSGAQCGAQIAQNWAGECSSEETGKCFIRHDPNSSKLTSRGDWPDGRGRFHEALAPY